MRHFTALSTIALALSAAACSSGDSKAPATDTTTSSNQPAASDTKMTFFVTTRGMGEGEMREIASLIDDALAHGADPARQSQIRQSVRALASRFPLYV